MINQSSQIIFRIASKGSEAHASLQRTLVLAEAFIRRGGRVHFAIDQVAQGTREVLAARGYSEITISAHPGSEEDVQQMLCAIVSTGARAVVVDGSSFGSDYLEALASKVYTAVIDQSTARNCNRAETEEGDEHARTLPVQLIINPSFSADERFYACKASSTLLLGPNYQMVSPEIAEWPKPDRQAENIDPNILRLFLATGNNEETARILDCMPAPHMTTVVSVVGDHSCPLLDEAARVACSRGYIIEQIPESGVTDALMFCDGAIVDTRSHTALRAYYAVPSLSVCLGEDEEREAQRLVEEGANVALAPISMLSNQDLGMVIHEFIRDEGRRLGFGRRLSSLVDGQGADRILDVIAESMQPHLQISRAA